MNENPSVHITEEFFFLLRYNWPLFADTNSVICKIYVVGADAHIRPRVDVGIAPYENIVGDGFPVPRAGRPHADNIDTNRQILLGDT